MEGAITATIKDGLIERREEAEELIEGDSLALGKGEGASLTQDGEELGPNEKLSVSEGEGDVADLETVSLGEGVTKTEPIAFILLLEESEEDPDPEIVSLSL